MSLNKIEIWLKENFNLYLLLLFIALNIFLIIYAVKINNFYSIKGQIGFIALAILLYFLRSKLKMNEPTFMFLLFGFALHVSNVLGNFYYKSPIQISWDYITHIVSFIGFTLLFFNFNKENINNKRIFCFRNIFLFITLFLTVGGVGVLVEIGEYAGYAILGMKDGSLLFGGGDSDRIIINSDVINEIEMHGGGWYDSMSDLLINSYTSLITLIILFVNHFRNNRRNK